MNVTEILPAFLFSDYILLVWVWCLSNPFDLPSFGLCSDISWKVRMTKIHICNLLYPPPTWRDLNHNIQLRLLFPKPPVHADSERPSYVRTVNNRQPKILIFTLPDMRQNNPNFEKQFLYLTFWRLVITTYATCENN